MMGFLVLLLLLGLSALEVTTLDRVQFIDPEIEISYIISGPVGNCLILRGIIQRSIVTDHLC